MRRYFALLLVFIPLISSALEPTDTHRWVEASDLTMIGKLMDTPNPYWRVDTTVWKGFTSTENKQIRCSAGLGVVFRTDSRNIVIEIERRAPYYGSSTTQIASAGFDLYIRKDGKWIWAGDVAFKPDYAGGPQQLIANMDGSVHECLLYFPVHTELYSCRLGFDEGCLVEAMQNPFRHRIVFSGSSYTHGSSTARPGMSYPLQFERHTGMQALPLGCGGNGKLQMHYALALASVEADAFVFDQFSNPKPEIMMERFFPFLETIRNAHPGVPIIFQQTIYRESGNFDLVSRKHNQEKMDLADSLMAIAIKRYPDVYYIKPSADDGTHEYSVDGTHPNDHGYYLWSRSIEKPILRILRRYGIR